MGLLFIILRIWGFACRVFESSFVECQFADMTLKASTPHLLALYLWIWLLEQ